METSKFIGGLTRAIVDVAVFGAMSVQPSADQWRENFAEAQVPYAKIMGCAKFGTARVDAILRAQGDGTK